MFETNALFDNVPLGQPFNANQLNNLFGAYQGYQTSRDVNNSVQSGLGQNQAVIQGQLGNLNNQIAQSRQQAQDMYQRSLQDVTGQNQGLQGNIDTMTSNLASLTDPNSAYMQMARQRIERQDAAAGRNSQWGERETQLAALLSEQMAKYSPGIQSSITQARNQISQNNQGLASLYSTANNPADRNTLATIQLLNSQLANTNAQNTTGRQAQNSATNNLTGLIGQGIGGLSRLFGGNGGNGMGGGYGLSNIFDWNTDSGAMGALQGLTGMGSTDLFGYGQGYFDNADFGTTSDGGDPYSSGWKTDLGNDDLWK